MPDTITITLDGKSYTVRRLTIRQQMELGIGVALADAEDPQDNVRRGFDRIVSIIVAALSEDHPEMTRDALLKTRPTADERRDAVNAILDFAGLIRTAVVKQPGETEAASTGASSSAASPQP